MSERSSKNTASPAPEKEVRPEPPRRSPLQRILALAGILFLLGLYGSTMVFALMDSPGAKRLLMASVFSTVFVPILLYGILLAARVARQRRDENKKDREV